MIGRGAGNLGNLAGEDFADHSIICARTTAHVDIGQGHHILHICRHRVNTGRRGDWRCNRLRGRIRISTGTGRRPGKIRARAIDSDRVRTLWQLHAVERDGNAERQPYLIGRAVGIGWGREDGDVDIETRDLLLNRRQLGTQIGPSATHKDIDRNGRTHADLHLHIVHGQ